MLNILLLSYIFTNTTIFMYTAPKDNARLLLTIKIQLGYIVISLCVYRCTTQILCRLKLCRVGSWTDERVSGAANIRQQFVLMLKDEFANPHPLIEIKIFQRAIDKIKEPAVFGLEKYTTLKSTRP